MSNEFVMVPRGLLAEAEASLRSTGFDVSLSADLRKVLAQPAEQNYGEPVGHFTFCHDKQKWLQGKPKGPEFLHLFTPLYTHSDPGEVEQLQLELSVTKKLYAEACQASYDFGSLRAQLADRDALLQRALPYLSNTPDLVQHGAEDLADEIRSVSAWRPCYGPNEWGTECGKCTKCKSASAEPSVPLAWHVGGNGYDRICFEKPADLPSSPCIQAIHDQRQLIDLLKRYDLRNEEAGATAGIDDMTDLATWKRRALERKP